VTRGVIWPYGLAWTRDSTSLVYSDQLSGSRLWRVSIQGDEPPRQSASDLMMIENFR